MILNVVLIDLQNIRNKLGRNSHPGRLIFILVIVIDFSCQILIILIVKDFRLAVELDDKSAVMCVSTNQTV